MGSAMIKSPSPRLCIIPIRLVIIAFTTGSTYTVYIQCIYTIESLACVASDFFQHAITITLLILMLSVEEHSKEADQEAFQYATHINLSSLLSVYAILYNGVVVLSTKKGLKTA